MRTLIVLGLATMFAGFAGNALAVDVIDAHDPAVILDIAKGYGSAEMGKDSGGDPMITGRLDGNKYGVLFYGCKSGKNCNDIQFYAAWGGAKTTMDALNSWNRDNRFAKAYLDKDGDPALEMDVNLDHGVTRANLDDTFNWWSMALKAFKQKVLE